MVNLLWRKIFNGNLNEAISLAEVASNRFPWKIFLRKKATLKSQIFQWTSNRNTVFSGRYYENHVIYEQAFPKCAWVLVKDLKFLVYDIYATGVNELGESETSDVAEKRPVRRPSMTYVNNQIIWENSGKYINVSRLISSSPLSCNKMLLVIKL